MIDFLTIGSIYFLNEECNCPTLFAAFNSSPFSHYVDFVLDVPLDDIYRSNQLLSSV